MTQVLPERIHILFKYIIKTKSWITECRVKFQLSTKLLLCLVHPMEQQNRKPCCKTDNADTDNYAHHSTHRKARRPGLLSLVVLVDSRC